MTSPQNVGTVEVDLIANAKGLGESIRKEVESAFKGLDFDKLIRESIGNRPIKIPVTPDFDASGIDEKVRQARAPKVPVKVDADTSEITQKIRAVRAPAVKVEVDPLLAAFQAEVRSQVAALARSANAKIPIGADTAGLRAQLGADLEGIQHSLKAQVPTEPGSRAEYEAKLKAQLEEVSHRVKQSVPVEPDSKGSGFLGKAGDAGTGLNNLISNVPGLNLVSSAIGGIGQAVTSVLGAASQLGGSLGGALGEAAGPIGSIVTGLLAAGAAAGALGFGIVGAVTFAIPAITALAGTIAAVPGLLAGVGAGAGTLLLGFKGISDAFKPKAAGAGGSAGQQAAQQAQQIASASRQVEAARRGITAANRSYEASERSLAAAERGVASAQRNLVDAEQAVADAQKHALQAQVAVNKARQEAADDLVDLNLQLKGSKLSEQEATVAVTDALRELNAVKLTGNIPDIQKADLAYQRAQLTLQQSTQSTKELSAQTADANKKGVEGSDKVQSALQEQQSALQGVKKAQEGVLDAQNGIIDAADSLKSAQDGVASAADGIKSATDSLASAQASLAQAEQKQATGAAAAAAQVTKLAPAAQKFVDAVKNLKPAFEDLRLDVQQKLFDGLSGTINKVALAWDQPLHMILGNYATTFNNFFKDLGNSISSPKFVTDIEAGAEGAREGLQNITGAITKDLVPAFGELAAAAGPFLSQLGGYLAEVVSKFSKWVEDGKKSGKLADFFERASQAMKDIFAIGGTVASIIGSIFTIITGSSPNSGKNNPLETFKDGLQKIADYLGDPKNQKKIEDFIGKVEDAVNKALTLANEVAGIYDNVKRILGGSDEGGGGKKSSVWVDIGSGIITGIAAGMSLEANLIWDTLKAGFDADIKRTKDFFGIHSPSTLMAGIGKDIIQGLINGIGSSLGGLSTRAGQLKTTITNKLSDAGSWLQTHGRNAVNGLINGMTTTYNSLSVYAGNARVYVQNALSGAGNWLYTHGRAVIQGLINGISSALGGLGSFLGSVGTFIQQHKGPLPKDRLLLVGAGQAIMGGLIGGISSQKDQLAAELADVTSIVAGTQIPGLSSAADAALSASVSAQGQQQLQLSWANGATSDPLLRAFQTLINVQFRGDVQAAFTGA